MDVELLDVAADRVERQRAYHRGHVPFPNTPDLAKLDQRLAEKGLAKGSAIFVRIFKATSELELWMQKGEAFVLLDTYPICHWTGSVGPKLKEGDRQSPEGFYSVTDRQTRLVGRWQRAFNLGFPNLHDQLNKRTGSFILIHGGCSSIGCFAMTEQVQDEIYELAAAALKRGQGRFHVHVFPFRMTDAAMAENAEHAWSPFWRELKPAYDSFERTRVPPRVGVCHHRYQAVDGEPGSTGDGEALSMWRPAPAGNGDGQVCLEPERRANQTSQTLSASRTAETVDVARPATKKVRRAAAPGGASREAGGSAAETGGPEIPNGFDAPRRRAGSAASSGG